MMRCCGGRWLQRTIVMDESKIIIWWHCEQCGFVFKEDEE